MRIHRAVRVGFLVSLVTLLAAVGLSLVAARLHGRSQPSFMLTDMAASLLFGGFAAALVESIMSVDAASIASLSAGNDRTALKAAGRRGTLVMVGVSVVIVAALRALRQNANPAKLGLLLASVLSGSAYAIYLAVLKRDEWLATGRSRAPQERESRVLESFASRHFSAWKRHDGALTLTDARIAFTSLGETAEILDLPLSSIRAVRAMRGIQNGIVLDTEKASVSLYLADPDRWVTAVRGALGGVAAPVSAEEA